MRALTLTQPWAGLVASGIKLVENRPRSIVKREDFGKPFAIHASRVIDEDVYRRIREIAPDICDYDYDNLTDEELDAKYPWYRLSRITSAVIAVATIERAVSEFSAIHVRQADAYDLYTGGPVDIADQRRWFFGPIGYVLRDVRALAKPVPCRGFQGFWRLDERTEAMVREQMAEAA